MSTANTAGVRGKIIALWALTALLAIAFFLAGGTKVIGHAPHPANFARWGFAPWVMYAVGLYEVVGAILLLVPRFSAWGALWLIANMVGAVLTRIHSAEYREVVPPIVLMALLSIVVFARRESLALAKGSRAATTA